MKKAHEMTDNELGKAIEAIYMKYYVYNQSVLMRDVGAAVRALFTPDPKDTKNEVSR